MVGVENILPSEIAAAPFGSRAKFALSDVNQLARRIGFPANATVFAENEPTIAVYRLTRGTAAIFRLADHGRKRIVGFALPGDFLNTPFVDRNSCSVDAISEVAVCQFPTHAFLSYLQAHPNSLARMLENTVEQINGAQEHIALLGRSTAEERFVKFVIDWRARIGRRGALSNLVPLPMSRRDIAEYLGLTIETVSRVLGKLERENVLRVIPDGLQLMGPAERPFLFEKSSKASGPTRLRSARQLSSSSIQR